MLRSRRKREDEARRVAAAAAAADEERLEAMVGPRGVWMESQAFQLDFLRARGLTPDDSVLDIGCGPLRGGIVLIDYLAPGNYVGIDVRAEVIAEAERQISERGLAGKAPAVFTSTSFGRDELEDRTFDVIWSFQVLYHLDDALVGECLAQIERRLRPGGAAYANVNTEFPDGQWKEFPFVQRPVGFYEELGSRHGLRVETLGEMGTFGYTTKVGGHRNQMLHITASTP